MRNEELQHTFDSLLRAAISTPQLTRLVNRSIRIAAGLLKTRFNRYLAILYDAGYTAESAAARCVEGMFLPQADVPCARLTAYLRSELDLRGPALNGDSERLLKRCVFLSVQQSIPDLLGEFDPQYRKILRMVTDTIAQSDEYRREKGFFDDMVTRGGEEAVHRHEPSMLPDEIIALLSRRASPDDSTQTLVGHVFDILHETPQVRRILPLGQLVTILRDFFNLYWKFSNEDLEDAPPGLFEEGDAERLAAPVAGEISAGILRTYRERGTLDEAEAAGYAAAVRDLLLDLAAGTAVPWFEYHEKQFPHRSYEEYREHYRGRFEYVLGSAKELFLLRCRKYFLSDFSANAE